MLAKKVEHGGRDWDTHLPFVLFAYGASLQESTKNYLFIYCMDMTLGSQLPPWAGQYATTAGSTSY